MTSPNGKYVVLLRPLSLKGSRREVQLRRTLKLRGDVRTCDQEFHESSALVPAELVSQLLAGASHVLVLPRKDGTIGAGTVRDIGLATALHLPVHVVRRDGRQMRLKEAQLEPVGERRLKWAARFVGGPDKARLRFAARFHGLAHEPRAAVPRGARLARSGSRPSGLDGQNSAGASRRVNGQSGHVMTRQERSISTADTRGHVKNSYDLS